MDGRFESGSTEASLAQLDEVLGSEDLSTESGNRCVILAVRHFIANFDAMLELEVLQGAGLDESYYNVVSGLTRPEILKIARAVVTNPDIPQDEINQAISFLNLAKMSHLVGTSLLN